MRYGLQNDARVQIWNLALINQEISQDIFSCISKNLLCSCFSSFHCRIKTVINRINSIESSV